MGLGYNKNVFLYFNRRLQSNRSIGTTEVLRTERIITDATTQIRFDGHLYRKRNEKNRAILLNKTKTRTKMIAIRLLKLKLELKY